MNKPMVLVATALLVAFPSLVQAKIERVVEKTFHVSAGGALHVETQGGNIRVTPSDSNEVKVTAIQVFRTNSESEADELAKKLVLTIEQSGNDVAARAKYEGSRAGLLFKSWPPVNVSFVISVPKQYNATMQTSGGNLEVGDLAGKVDGRTSGGNISVGRVVGPVDVNTSGGNIRVVSAGQRLQARTSGGDIRVQQVEGRAELQTSGGNIAVESAGGAIDAETSGGNVHARFADTLTSECSLRTSGGNVIVEVSSSAKFDLEARTSGGEVRVSGVSISIQDGAIGKSKVTGKVNGGGPTLRLRTSGGDVRLAAK